MQNEAKDAQSPKLLEPGDMFGDYTVEKLLGKGGMGAVYLVRAPDGERYAVKLMFPEIASKNPNFRKRFAREAEFAMKIKHKNLISVYDVGEDPEMGYCYIIMDYLPGGSVKDRLAATNAVESAAVSNAAATVRGSAAPVATGKTPSALYCVVDLSAGPKAEKYPVSYLNAEPKGGWTDEYKTTKLVLRRIELGSFKMGRHWRMTLTKPFYIGVFEMTQKQYELVTGTNPSEYKGDTRPADSVSWNQIRGDSSVHDWPTVRTVDPDSFVGRLDARTGLSFDLPTEAQWEYACRAGTTSRYNNGGETEDDRRKIGRFFDNCSDGRTRHS